MMIRSLSFLQTKNHKKALFAINKLDSLMDAHPKFNENHDEWCSGYGILPANYPSCEPCDDFAVAVYLQDKRPEGLPDEIIVHC